jgi:hypothetical protein
MDYQKKYFKYKAKYFKLIGASKSNKSNQFATFAPDSESESGAKVARTLEGPTLDVAVPINSFWSNMPRTVTDSPAVTARTKSIHAPPSLIRTISCTSRYSKVDIS